MEHDKDLQLVKLIRNGDRSAMADLYSRYIGYLTAVCSRYIPDNDDMRDTLQNSFVKILSSLDRFSYRGPGSLKAWMSRIVANEALKFIEQGRKTDIFKSEIEKEGETADYGDPEIDDVPAAVIQKMIQELPEGYRTVFNLYVFEEKSHKEIAGILGITDSTSASQFHRAKNILAKRIREYKNKQNS